MNKPRPVASIEERLEYYYDKLNQLDDEDVENMPSILYLKDKIGYWKKELIKEQEQEYFGELDKEFFME